MYYGGWGSEMAAAGRDGAGQPADRSAALRQPLPAPQSGQQPAPGRPPALPNHSHRPAPKSN